MSYSRLALLPKVVRQIITTTQLYKGIDWTRSTSRDMTGAFVDDQRELTDDLARAEVVSSEIRESWATAEVAESWANFPAMHYPLLDLDFPVVVVPSSTPGHSHLYLKYPMGWDHYEKLLTVMAEVGLIEEGFLAASRKRKATFLRLPWIKKGEERAHALANDLELVEAFLAAPAEERASW